MAKHYLEEPLKAPELQNLRLRKFCEKLKHNPEYARIFALVETFPQAEVFMVGGAVRDAVLETAPKDVDFIIRGVTPVELEAYFLAEPGAKLDLVGRNFGVYKYRPAGSREMIDLALPRSEQSTGLGKREFAVQADPNLPITADLSRRDFTFNAMAYDINKQSLIDPYQGSADLRQGIIRCVGDPRQRFNEDRTRMLRALRFACQLNLNLAPETEAVLREMIGEINLVRTVETKEGKANERVVPFEAMGKEFFKAFNCAPMRTLELWLATGALAEMMPELLPNLDALRERMEKVTPQTKLIIKICLLLKDFGDGEISLVQRLSPRSTDHSFDLTEYKFLRTWQDVNKLLALPLPLLERKIERSWQADLLQLLAFDSAETEFQLLKARLELIAQAPAPLLNGADLLAQGLRGSQIQTALDKIRDAQLQGTLTTKEQALNMLKNYEPR